MYSFLLSLMGRVMYMKHAKLMLEVPSLNGLSYLLILQEVLISQPLISPKIKIAKGMSKISSNPGFQSGF
jgi:hypothetical protein